MWLGRKRSWPKIDLYQKSGRGDIKAASESELDRLMSKASQSGWSANGRPGWFDQHRSKFKAGMLVILGTEGEGVWRCITTVVLSDKSGGRFTLDVSRPDFEALKDLDYQAVVALAHRYLATFPPVDLDSDQASTWDQSVWKKWGES
jgi:hypothetical protein